MESNEDLRNRGTGAEKDHLRMTFQKNCYPERFIASALRQGKRQEETQQAEETATEVSKSRRKTLCILPYVKGVSDKLVDICRKVGIHPVCQQKSTLRSLLTRVKGLKKHGDKGVVYQIPCNKVYIGERGRPLKIRISEHKRAVATGDVRNANATHWMETCHSRDWSAATVGDKSSRWRERKIKESVYIKGSQTIVGLPGLNIDSGSSLSPVWNPLIRQLQKSETMFAI